MYVAILGRQPALGVGELERTYGTDAVQWFSDQSALVMSDSFSIDNLGGTQKAGRIRVELTRGDWRRASVKIVQEFSREWENAKGKITLGISAYGFEAHPRDIQKTGIVLKQKLKASGVSLRLIPNTDTALSSATAHHNKLGLSANKIELIVVRARNGRIIIAESIGTQNITAYALRDQKRPKRDAFVGMLPPKLAQIMINLTSSQSTSTRRPRLLDPFCGTGVVLQEAILMGYDAYGTDLSEKMIDYSRTNLDWLINTHQNIPATISLHEGDAMTATWQQPINAVVCEAYLGQPFSAPPTLAKLTEVRKNCDYIISSFLKNLAPQIPSDTPLCIAVPAWRGHDGLFTHLPLINQLEQLGYKQYSFKNVAPEDLLYYREDQVVARELLVLVRS